MSDDTETKPAHDPLPWSISGYGDVKSEATKGSFSKVCVNGFSLACGPRNPDAEANTRLIVKAVNSHAALVEALRLARAVMWDGRKGASDYQDFSRAIDKANDALDAAR